MTYHQGWKLDEESTEQIAVPNPPPEALRSLLGSGTEQTKTFHRNSVSGVKTQTPAVNTVTALDPMQVKTLNPGGGASEGEVELYPLAIRAKGDRELNAESEEFRVVRKEIEEITEIKEIKAS